MNNYGADRMDNIDSLFLIPELQIEMGIGKANYSMSRGTFKTKDNIQNRIRLQFMEQQENVYIFQHQNVQLQIEQVLIGTDVRLLFHTDSAYNRLWINFPASADEHIYGCGEQFTHFDLKGQSVNIWVSEHHSIKKLISKFLREKLFGVRPNYLGKFKHQQTYYSQPSFMSSKGYFLHADANSYQNFTFHKDYTLLYFREIPKSITLLFANDFISLSKKISTLLGIQKKLPTWTETGAIIASQGGTNQMKQKINHALEAGVPLAGIWCQDWSGQLLTAFGSQVFWNWQVDETLYNGLKDEIVLMRKKGIHFLGYINTFLKEDTPLYKEGKAKQYFVLDQQHQVYLIKSTTFNAGIIDLTNPDAYEWYKGIIKKNMIGLGMSGWMADFGEYLPTDSIIHGGFAEEYHNVWPQLWAKLNAEAIAETNKEDEVFFFTRAGYTETIKYTNMMWAGDQHVDFSKAYGLPSAIVSTLSMSTIGIGLNHSDIGGYTTILHMKRSKELMMRWAEMNIFAPLYRCHEGNKPESNVQFDYDLEVLNHFAHMSRIFQQLSPYLHELKLEYYKNGTPISRPLFYHFNEEEAYTTQYEFMYGSELLVSPVINDKERVHEVYLPKGNWIQLITNQEYEGGTHLVDAPIGLPIAFYKKQSKYEALFQSIQ